MADGWIFAGLSDKVQLEPVIDEEGNEAWLATITTSTTTSES